jgi:hypothetical protein
LCDRWAPTLIGRRFHHRKVEGDPARMKMARQMGADVVLDPKQCDDAGGGEAPDEWGRGRLRFEAPWFAITFEKRASLAPARRHSEQPRGFTQASCNFLTNAFAAGLGD